LTDDNLLDDLLFKTTCMNNYITGFDYQIIEKEVKAKNIKNALIRFSLKEENENNFNHFKFEINKNDIKQLIDHLNEVYKEL